MPRLPMQVMTHALSPSAQIVLQELCSDEPLTSGDIQRRTGLPRRTVSSALRALRTRGALRERISLQDARQTYFWVAMENS